ncbi:MAG: methyltransferase type 11 [Pseudomonadota bacterium]
MPRVAALLAVFLLLSCSHTPPPAPEPPDSAVASAAIEAAVAHPGRPGVDTIRDATRKPVEVLKFFGIRPGMRVLDVFAGGGYYSEILNHVVGENGQVTLYNNGGWAGYAGAGLDRRLANNRLPNVVNMVAETDATRFEPASYDAALFILGFHDLYYVDTGWPAIDADQFIAALHAAIKPGGMLGIIDHNAVSGADINTANTLHRIDPAIIQQKLLAAGFILEGSSNLLRNPEDDRLKPMGDPSIRGRTDRVVQRYRKST